MGTRPCLSPSEAELWVRRAQTEPDRDGIGQHLDSCDTCRKLCEEIREDDQLLARARPLIVGDAGLNLDETAPIQRAERTLPRIDGYRITGVLGQGGMGIVYRAVQTRLNRGVALKVLPAIVGSASPSAVSRFRREATAAARLHHTNIVPVYDFGECRDAYFYAMELIDGQPLNLLIKRFGEANIASASQARVAELIHHSVVTPDDANAAAQPTNALKVEPAQAGASAASTTGRGRAYYQQVARWVANVADALHYAHGQGIIHRDIKPANLILCNDGRIMLTDFGLAKSSEDESVTQTGALLGTVRYLSPEQAMARRIPIDHRTDLYSLGAVMYELLCFQTAFPGSDDKQILASIITRDPISPRKILPIVPVDLETICLKLLEKAPESRYATARAVVDDLRRYASDLPIVGKRAGPLKRVAKFVRRHKAASVAVVALIALLALGVFAQAERGRRKQETVRLIAEKLRARDETSERLVQEGVRLHESLDYVAAGWRYRDALTEKRQNVAALANLARLKKDLYNSSPEKPQRLLLDALDLCDEALAIRPDALVWNVKGVVLKTLGRYGEAVEAYRAASDLKPNEWALWNNLGIVQALTHDFSAAQASLLRATELAEKSERCREDPLRNYASLLWSQGDPAAMDWIGRAIDCKRDDAGARAVRARMLTCSGRPEDAAQAALDVQTADELTGGQNLLVKRAASVVHLQQGDCAKARDAAEAVTRLGSPSALTRSVLAVCATREGRADAAALWGDVERMLQTPPNGTGSVWVDAPPGALWIETRQECDRIRGAGSRP